MGKTESVKQITEGIERFAPSIRFVCDGSPQRAVEEAFTSDPRRMFYIDSWSVQRLSRSEYVLNIRYDNRELSLKDIRFARSATEIINILSQYIGNFKPRFALIAESEEEVERALTLFEEKFSPLFPNYTSLSYVTQSSELCAGKSFVVFEAEYRIGKVMLGLMEMAVQEEVKRLSELLFLPDMPDETKIYLAHNFLATSVTYYLPEKLSNLKCSYIHSAYGALITKKCVCQGVTEAFQRLMEAAKIPCEVAFGQVFGQDDYHVWNIIKLQGGRECYHIDVTWDIGDTASFEYFCKSDDFLKGQRTWNKEFNPVCFAPRNIYRIAKNYILQHRGDLIKRGISQKVLGF